MIKPSTTRKIARTIPARLQRLRGQSMLCGPSENLGVVETECPGCGGTGWLQRRRLEYCPLCCGFQEVPCPLARWFENRARHRENLPRQSAGAAPSTPPDAHSGRPAGPAKRARIRRSYGRLAERMFRVSFPAPSADIFGRSNEQHAL